MTEQRRKARHSPAEVKAFKTELVKWMKKNNLAHDTRWETADEHYGPEHLTYPFPQYLVLFADSDMHDIIWDHTPPEMTNAKARKFREEFKETVKRHGMWYEAENEVAFCFIGHELD